jgi:hypothetical protein
MSKPQQHKNRRKLHKFYNQVLRQPHFLTQQQINWLLRIQIVLGYRPQPQAGFVLPTVTMSLLVLSLVVGSILIRTTDRAIEAIRGRENSVVYNSAAPAIDRAKAKLEYLFQSDSRFPTSIPGEKVLSAMMSNTPNLDSDSDGTKDSMDLNGDGVADVAVLNNDIYTLPDEVRVDINNDDVLDNAWSYDTDLNGDGTPETVTYSVLMETEVDTNNDGTSDVSIASDDTLKAANLVTRSGPLSLNSQATSSASCTLSLGDSSQGWFPINSATVRKNFQINTVVSNNKDAGKSVTALEFQQDRQLDKGNKFGAWFRYDLLIHAGPNFNWNGAMHTDGNLILFNDDHRFHLVSAPDSCVEAEGGSDITLNQVVDDNNNIDFQGQLIIDDDGGTIRNSVDLDPTTNITLSNASDSREGDSPDYKNDNIFNFSVNALKLFTEDVTESRFDTDPTNVAVRDSDWTDTNVAERIFNKRQDKPYVDDTYRADNRFGPRPNYGRDASDQVTAANIGTKIPSSHSDLLEMSPPSEALDLVGLDGYWERRAYIQGLRIITGQRLELGNAFGWQGNNDPLYPPDNSFNPPSPMDTRDNEFRQQRTWRDNLAAGQATAIYHHADNKDFPVACLATTAHPGTQETLNSSKTFAQDSLDFTDDGTANPTTTVVTDFFTGVGTNGWEFNPPTADATAFAAEINDNTSSLYKALTNLANFAGDPSGAFPPTQNAAASDIAHPYSHLTMWGDFSNLRRTMEDVASGTAYIDLSLADMTTLHTAACNLGMLAHSIEVEEAIYNETIIPLETDAKSEVDMGNAVTKAVTGQGNKEIYKFVENQDIIDDGDADNDDLISSGNGSDLVRTPQEYVDAVHSAGGTAPTTAQLVEYYSLFTPDQYIEAYKDAPGGGTADIAKLKAFAEAAIGVNGGYKQLERDRIMGFQPGLPAVNLSGGSGWDATTGQSSNTDYHLNSSDGGTISLITGCDPDIFDPIVVGSGSGLIPKKVGLALAFCHRFATGAAQPKYPSLYYLFPLDSHDHDGEGAIAQPSSEEYINDTYVESVNPATTNNDLYKVVDLSSITIRPRLEANWTLPIEDGDGTTNNAIINNEITTIALDGTATDRHVAFLDRVIQNGRQLMAVRTLTLDLNLFRSNTISSESWIPNSGVIYAFREDAVREDAISRPAGNTWTNCNTENNLIGTNTCHMDISDNNDPPVNTITGISPKPVDTFPDPDRRPHGFRLINGSRLDRPGTDRGMTLISDQPIYIQGDFNLHQDSEGNLLEEFESHLNDDWSNFYDRDEDSTTPDALDVNFAKPGTDRWRPTEILSDAITVVSDNFCDGTIESGMMRDNGLTSCTGGGVSSFLNTLIQDNTVSDWIRENPEDNNSPIRVTRNGEFQRNNSGTITTFDSYDNRNSNRNSLSPAQDTIVNTVFVSGITPVLPYGGLHNFPRFLENWENDDDLRIAGSFIQLNFSTYDTANYYLSDWEPGINSAGNIGYYSPPNRLWGYDVGLLYNPPGPVADRLFSTSARRSEFYKELSADDPYSRGLLCAEDSEGNRIYPNENCPS